jgi:ribosomal protein S18 acetylase RimI-like enzyme
MSEPPYSIRPARSDDLDRLVELMLALQDHLEASNPDLWRMKAETRSHLGDQLATRLAAPNSCSLVARHEEQGVVGMAFGRVVTNTRYVPTRTGSIDQVFVRADHRRAGLGARLVAGLCQFFSAEGVTDLSLRYVVGNEEAAAFWRALGFSPRIVTAGARQEAVQARLSRVR